MCVFVMLSCLFLQPCDHMLALLCVVFSCIYVAFLYGIPIYIWYLSVPISANIYYLKAKLTKIASNKRY